MTIKSSVKFYRFFILFLLFCTWFPGIASAQQPAETEDLIEWQELKTEKFTIVYAEQVIISNRAIECRCGIHEAEYYATFIDGLYNDLAAVFAVQLPLPVNLRLFPTEDSYYQVNPIAERIPGVIAHALNSRDEIAVALPRTEPLTDEELINNIRHEMTHLFASMISDGNLTTGFQEGIAQYLEKPGVSPNHDPILLEQALAQDRLLTWAELDLAQNVYRDPQVAYPQALSIVAFLIDRYGLKTFIQFLEVSSTEPGYRSALESAYGTPADDLEAAWLAYLPDYLAGRWQVNAIYAYDLSDMRELMANGAYSDAVTRLTEAIALLETTDQFEVLTEAEALLAQAHQGQAAAALADEARTALAMGDYTSTIEKGQASLTIYENLGYRHRTPEIQNYIYRAELGQNALIELEEGERLLSSLRFIEAERTLYEATAMLQTLDNPVAVARGEALLIESAWQQKLVMYALFGAALILLIFNSMRRVFNRFIAEPLDVEFT